MEEGAVTRGRRRVRSIDIREEVSVTVLSVKELSTPVRSVYDSGKQQLVTRILYLSALLILHYYSLLQLSTPLFS